MNSFLKLIMYCFSSYNRINNKSNLHNLHRLPFGNIIEYFCYFSCLLDRGRVKKVALHIPIIARAKRYVKSVCVTH